MLSSNKNNHDNQLLVQTIHHCFPYIEPYMTCTIKQGNFIALPQYEGKVCHNKEFDSIMQSIYSILFFSIIILLIKIKPLVNLLMCVDVFLMCCCLLINIKLLLSFFFEKFLSYFCPLFLNPFCTSTH